MSCLYTSYDLLGSFCAFFNSRDVIIHIGEKRLKTIRLLGEGGFSYVYLVKDFATGHLYALKKVRCPFGEESIRTALKEVEAYQLFRHATIIRVLDHAILQEPDGSKVVYILLPYYERGNLQDLIDANRLNGTTLGDIQVLQYFAQICEALSLLHNYRSPSVMDFDECSGVDPEDSRIPLLPAARLPHSSLSIGVQGEECIPYAHYDLKPANVMLDDTGRLVLMDFGSCKPATKRITSRAEGLQIQDMAAEACTMPYRAPELFDCKTNSTINEKVDIWSLGCVLYALQYGHSPFETSQTESGSIAMAVLNCQYRMPRANGCLSQAIQDMISQCLDPDAQNRPSAVNLLASTRSLLEAQKS